MSSATTSSIAPNQPFYNAAYWSTLAFIVVGIVSLFFPLYPPAETLTSKALWLVENRNTFIIGWFLQIVLMATVAASLAGVAWMFFREKPVQALITWMVLFLSVIAFLIPKFFAIWAIPQMAEAAAAGGRHSEVAYQMLAQLETSEITFSMFTTYDYLGFLMYAISGLLLAGPLFKVGTIGTKISSACLAVYGVLYIAASLMIMFKIGGDVDMDLILMGLNPLLVIALFPLVGLFYRKKSSSDSSFSAECAA